MMEGYTEGTKAKYLQPRLEEELKKAKLYNQYYGPNIESEIGLRGAQAGQAKAHTGLLGEQTRAAHMSNANLPAKLREELAAAQMKNANPLLGMTGHAGQIGALMYLQQHPELMQQQQMQQQAQMGQQGQQGQPNPNESQIPSAFGNQSQQGQQQRQLSPREMLHDSIMRDLQGKNKEFAPSNIRKLQDELRDIESGYYPGTNRQERIETKQQVEDLASPYREKLGGLKQGEHYLYDENTHEKIGINRPLTPKEQETEKGREFFNEVFPVINNGVKDFIGKDSIKNFEKYSREYGKNPKATEKIDNLLLANRLISAGVVNEAATLGAGKTNMSYRRLAESFPKSDIPSLIERFGKELRLPSEAFYKAGQRQSMIINQATQSAATKVPVNKNIYYHPEKHLKGSEEKAVSSKSKHYSDADIRNTAQKYGISEEEVRKKLKEASSK